MFNSKLDHRIIFIALITIVFAASAYAQNVYVSVTGDDDNNCSLSTPCRTITHAIGDVPEHGTIVVLSTGEYDLSVTIEKSVTVVGVKGVTASVGDITINPPSTNGARIVLRNLSISGLNVVGAVEHLQVEGCEFTQGIDIVTSGAVTLRNIKIRQNGNGLGVQAYTNQGLVKLAIEDSMIEGCVFGLITGANVKASVTNSSFRHNQTGIYVNGPTSSLHLDKSVVTHNTQDGINLVQGGTAYLSDSTISFNGQGVRWSSVSNAYSFGNNRIHLNTAQYAQVIPKVTLK